MTTRDDSEAASSSSSWFSFGSGLRTRRAPPTAEMLGTTATSMTTINGGEMTPRGLRRVRSLAELQQRLEQTQREIDSEDSIDESGSEEGVTYDFDDQDPEAIDGTAVADGGGGETSEYSTSASTVASAISSKYSSRVVSRSASRDGSPNRSRRTIEPLTPTGAASKSARALDLEILVSRTPKVGAGLIFQPRANHAAAACLPVLQSPYNTSNPHFGYPAYVPPSSLDPSGTPRSRFPRRRKRDLVRTLTYLAALRFLALHRSIQHRLNVLVAVLLRLTGFGWWNRWWRQGAGRRRNAAAAASGSEQHKDGSDKKVHWTASPAAASSSLDTGAPPPPPTSTSMGTRPVAHSPHHRSHHLHHQHLSSALASSSSSSSPTSPSPPLIDVDPSVLYLTLLFIIVRTPDRKDKVKRLARFLVVGVPTWSAAQARRLALRVLVGKARADALLNAERASQ